MLGWKWQWVLTQARNLLQIYPIKLSRLGSFQLKEHQSANGQGSLTTMCWGRFGSNKWGVVLQWCTTALHAVATPCWLWPCDLHSRLLNWFHDPECKAIPRTQGCLEAGSSTDVWKLGQLSRLFTISVTPVGALTDVQLSSRTRISIRCPSLSHSNPVCRRINGSTVRTCGGW